MAEIGILKRDKSGKWTNTELITTHNDNIGVCVNNLNNIEVPTSVFMLKHGKNGIHIVPTYPSTKGAKAT